MIPLLSSLWTGFELCIFLASARMFSATEWRRKKCKTKQNVVEIYFKRNFGACALCHCNGCWKMKLLYGLHNWIAINHKRLYHDLWSNVENYSNYSPCSHIFLLLSLSVCLSICEFITSHFVNAFLCACVRLQVSVLPSTKCESIKNRFFRLPFFRFLRFNFQAMKNYYKKKERKKYQLQLQTFDFCASEQARADDYEWPTKRKSTSPSPSLTQTVLLKPLSFLNKNSLIVAIERVYKRCVFASFSFAIHLICCQLVFVVLEKRALAVVFVAVIVHYCCCLCHLCYFFAIILLLLFYFIFLLHLFVHFLNAFIKLHFESKYLRRTCRT